MAILQSRGSRRHRVEAGVLALVAPMLATLAGRSSAAAAKLMATLVRTINLGALNPPIPDPSRPTYVPSRDRLLISGGEVDEMPIFQCADVLDATRNGILLQDRGVSTPQTKEPAGVTCQSSNDHPLAVDDDQQRGHDFAPGSDLRYGTAGFGSTDPADGLCYPPTGEVFVLEGSDDDVHRVSSGTNGVFDGPPVDDDTAGEFATPAFGPDDPEGIGYHVARDTLLIVDFQTDRVYELNRELMHINVIDIAGEQCRSGWPAAWWPARTRALARQP
jgi:hypothetical protein